MSDILRRIITTKVEEVAAAKAATRTGEIAAMAADMPPARAFTQRIRAVMSSGPAVIAELKKASPSAGIIRKDFQVDQIAGSYESAGAACLSVLTDRAYFKGANDFLQQARDACSLPALRKDFIIDPWQVYESRVLGADCMLLIVAALTRDQLQDLYGLARETGLDVLIEAHNEGELDAALATGASLLGVNNRDLHTFTTNLAVSERLQPLIPAGRIMVTESGIHSSEDVLRMERCGIHAFLVGEAFMRQEDPGGALRSLFF